MKRVYLIFIMSSLFLSISNAQTLIEQIERAYSALDSASYINKIVLSYAKSLEKNEEETYKLLYAPDSDSMKVAQWFNRTDSMYLKYLQKNKILNEPDIRHFENEVKSGTPLYVLNLKLKENRLTSLIRRTFPPFGGFFINVFSLDIPFLHCFKI